MSLLLLARRSSNAPRLLVNTLATCKSATRPRIGGCVRINKDAVVHTKSRLYFSSLPLAQEENPETRLFEDLDNLNPKTLSALDKKGIQTMTEIQARTWDAVSEGKDVVGRSRTGSGKVRHMLQCLCIAIPTNLPSSRP